MLCVHHIQWVREVPGGLHQCIQCLQVVSRKDVYPKLEDLTEELRSCGFKVFGGAVAAGFGDALPVRFPFAPADGTRITLTRGWPAAGFSAGVFIVWAP